jgi:hypothetical protein
VDGQRFGPGDLRVPMAACCYKKCLMLGVAETQRTSQAFDRVPIRLPSNAPLQVRQSASAEASTLRQAVLGESCGKPVLPE